MRRWKKRGGYKVAMSVIEMLANRGLFRERDLEAEGLSHNWLNIAEAEEVQPKIRALALRAHSVERARSDLARANVQRILERAANRGQFSLPRNGTFLSAQLPKARRHPVWAPADEWIAK